MTRTAEFRWVTCSRGADWATSQNRHLIRHGRDTTLCGATGMPQDVWRSNSIKEKCYRCMALAEVNTKESR